MAGRGFWKGYLKLSLVNCPVAMTPAVSERERIRFHTLNRATGNRVRSRYLDAVTDRPVGEDDQVKGYQVGEDDYVMLEDEELEAVALDSTRTIDIETFVPADSVGWIWYDTPHYLLPDDPVGEEAFAVIRAAMNATGTVGIARLVLYRRERAVLLEPRDPGIIVWTLRYGEEVREPDTLWAKAAKAEPAPDQLELVGRLIEQRQVEWDPALIDDPVQDRLRQVIDARKKGRRRSRPRAQPAEKPGNVVNIMDALRKSLAEEKKPRRR